jgi:hypothetical protein
VLSGGHLGQNSPRFPKDFNENQVGRSHAPSLSSKEKEEDHAKSADQLGRFQFGVARWRAGKGSSVVRRSDW